MAIDSWRLARLCGVSRGTVDRALHGRAEVGAKTREKVLRMAARHGYAPNAIGRALATGRTMTVGVVVFDLENSYFTEVVSAIERRARLSGHMMLLALSRKDSAVERQCVDYFFQKKVDGVIIIPVGKGRVFEQCLAAGNVPVVTFGNRLSPSFPHVGIDERAAAADAVTRLAAKGYERIIYYCPPLRHKGKMNLYGQERRLAGVEKAVTQCGCACETIIDECDVKARLASSSLKKKRTAVFCSNDIYAVELLRLAEETGLRVPGDLGVMGFDNLSFLRHVRPRLSTVSYPTAETGEKAVALLLEKMNGQSVSDIVIPHAIIEGETT